MKSRHNSAPLTDEDGDIWFSLAGFGRESESAAWIRGMLRSDRRDADIMNWAQTIRRPGADRYRMTAPLSDRVSTADTNPIDYGGDITRVALMRDLPVSKEEIRAVLESTINLDNEYGRCLLTWALARMSSLEQLILRTDDEMLRRQAGLCSCVIVWDKYCPEHGKNSGDDS